jgi:hypothetical protein
LKPGVDQRPGRALFEFRRMDLHDLQSSAPLAARVALPQGGTARMAAKRNNDHGIFPPHRAGRRHARRPLPQLLMSAGSSETLRTIIHHNIFELFATWLPDNCLPVSTAPVNAN